MATTRGVINISSVLFFLIVIISNNFYFASGIGDSFITCGSLIKLVNSQFKVRLHSHSYKYGTGSGQQSVTGIEDKGDHNSYWLVKNETGKSCQRGVPIACNSVIRLGHSATNKNLHSHLFPSPLSNRQEITAYGEQGEGDSGDHWRVICDGDFWERGGRISLKHVDTNAYLSVSGRTYGRPINGQNEVIGDTSLQPNQLVAQWQTMEGVYFHMEQGKPNRDNDHEYVYEHEHTEL